MQRPEVLGVCFSEKAKKDEKKVKATSKHFKAQTEYTQCFFSVTSPGLCLFEHHAAGNRYKSSGSVAVNLAFDTTLDRFEGSWNMLKYVEMNLKYVEMHILFCVALTWGGVVRHRCFCFDLCRGLGVWRGSACVEMVGEERLCGSKVPVKLLTKVNVPWLCSVCIRKCDRGAS